MDNPSESTDLVIPPGLTFRQELFARAFLACKGNATEAFQIAYDPPESTPKNQVASQAHRVRHNPRVAARINELITPIIEEHEITVNGLVSLYKEAYLLAKVQQNPAAMTQAVNGMAKVTGLDRLVIEDEVGRPINIIYDIPEAPDEKEPVIDADE